MHKQKTLLNYSGLYGEKNGVLLPDFIHMEHLSERSRTYDWEIHEHLHTELFQLFLLNKGGGTLSSQHRDFELRAPCAITIPVNTLHGFSFDPSTRGEVITLSESYLEEILSSRPSLNHEIQQLRVYGIDEKNHQELQYLKSKVRDELARPDSDQLGLQPTLVLMFICIYRLTIKERIDQLVSKNPSLRIFNDFQRLIRRSIREVKSVHFYASELDISTVHLNRVCQTVMQQTALKVIHDKVIEEAKKYLLNTTYSISEICYLLNFNDPAHFTKFFKKYVGVNPSEFRKE